MALPKAVIEFAIRGASSPENAADRIQQYERIQARSAERSKKIAMIKTRADGEILKLLSEVICTHDVRKYHGDPSGGSDSHEECLICGDQIHDKGYRRS